MEELPKAYDASKVEADIYKRWEDSGFFNPDNLPGDRTETFTVSLPPPNATGTLHLGHALEYSLQDAVVRYQRMIGKKVLWVPGTDHAAIATNTKVEKILIKEEGKNRHDIGREAFVKKVEDFVANSRSTMQRQIRKIGASLDWSREAFTFDEPRNLGVRTAFKRMYDAGLIYRGYRVINWDPKGQTSVSDDEVEHRPEKGFLYTFKYSADFPISIATTRPETKVGDTAVAVNPEDARYKEFVGKEYEVEFAGNKLKIKIVADKDIDAEFGTGAVGITPAHSIIDAEIAQRHNLPMVQVINEYAKMTEQAGPLVAGQKVKEARENVVQWLKNN
ncbi:MAG: class I tRNA ligase family protein, partial [Patescibacteria group bacterium]